MEDKGIDGKKIVKWMFKKWPWGMDSIDIV